MEEVMVQPLIGDIIEWDIKNWSTSLDFWNQKSSLNLKNGYALELGGRNGGISLWLAAKGCRVVCSDLTGPTDHARTLHDSYGVSHLIEYNNVDATDIPYEDDSFEVVTFKSVLGGVGSHNNKEAQRQAMKEIHRVLKPGGELLFAENLAASPIHKVLRKKFVSWGKKWRYPSIHEMNEFLEDFSQVHHLTRGFMGSFGRTERQRNLLASVDSVFHRMIPEQWKYIMMGVAKK